MAKDPRALLQQAEALRKSGRLSDAIDACLKALDAQPGLDALRVTLGRTYLESGQADLARQTLAEVFTRLPEHHLAGKLLAEAQKELGEAAAAEETCLKLLATYPRDREIEALLKSARAAAGDSSAAGAATAPREAAPARASAPMRAVAPQPAAHAAADEATVDPLPDYDPEDVAGGAPEATPPPPATATGAPVAMRAPTVIATTTAPLTPAATAPVAAPATAPVATTALPATTPAAPDAPVASVAAAKPPAGDALQTNTLAELYVKQGLVDRAIEVYRGMLKVDPANERARRRLEELQSAPTPDRAAAGPAGAVVARPAPAAPAMRVSPAPSAPAAPAATAPAASAASADPAAVARTAAIRRLEEWLTRMQSGRDAGGRTGR